MAKLFNVVLFSYLEETIYTSAILFVANVFHNAIERQRDLNDTKEIVDSNDNYKSTCIPMATKLCLPP